jgi:hypothetical protein
MVVISYLKNDRLFSKPVTLAAYYLFHEEVIFVREEKSDRSFGLGTESVNGRACDSLF